MDTGIGDVIAFEVFGTRWSWRLGVIQAIPAPRLREVVVYRKKWAQMPRTARGVAGTNGNVVSDEDEDEEEADLDATYVENGKGKLRTILTSSIIFNLGDEEDVVGDDGKSIRLDAQQQRDVEEAIKNFSAGVSLIPTVTVAGGGVGQGGMGGSGQNSNGQTQRDNFGVTIIPKFKLNLPTNDGEDPGYIALPLPTGRAQNIYDNATLDDGVPAEEKIVTLKNVLFEYEGQIKSLIEQVETLRGIAGSKSSHNLNAMRDPNYLDVPGAGGGGGILKGGGGGYPMLSARAWGINGAPSASPRKVRIAAVTDTHADPTSDMAAMTATMAASTNDIEALRSQLKAVTKQLSENRIKYERELQALKDKNAELQSVFEGWGAVAGTLIGGGAVNASAVADLRNARETLHTARHTYRKTARKSAVTDTSGEEQLNAAEAFLDLQQQMVNFIAQAEGQRSSRKQASNNNNNTTNSTNNATASPSKPSVTFADLTPTKANSKLRIAPKVPTTRAEGSGGGAPHSPSSPARSPPKAAAVAPTPPPAPTASPSKMPLSTTPTPAQTAAATPQRGNGGASPPSAVTIKVPTSAMNNTTSKLLTSTTTSTTAGSSASSPTRTSGQLNSSATSPQLAASLISPLSPPSKLPKRVLNAVAAFNQNISNLNSRASSPLSPATAATLTPNTANRVAAAAAATSPSPASAGKAVAPSPAAAGKATTAATAAAPATAVAQKTVATAPSPVAAGKAVATAPSPAAAAKSASPSPVKEGSTVFAPAAAPAAAAANSNHNATTTGLTTTASELFGATSAADLLGTTAGTVRTSKAKSKSKPKPTTTAAGKTASDKKDGTANDLSASPTSAGFGMNITASSSGHNLLSEFTKACGLMQASQQESDLELSKLRKENEENAKKIAEMMTQLELMRKMRDSELEILRAQIARLDAAAERKKQHMQQLSSSGNSPSPTSPTHLGVATIAVPGAEGYPAALLNARDLVTGVDISNMPSASPVKQSPLSPSK